LPEPAKPAAARSATGPAVRTATAGQPAAAESDQWEKGFASRFAPAANLPAPPASASPVSALAGTPTNNGAIVSGRGLY